MKIFTSSKVNNSSGSRRNVAVAITAVLAVIVVGLLIVTGKASGFFASSTAASGTVTGNAQVVDDSSAYGGKAVIFKAPVVTPSPSPVAECPVFPAFPDEKCTGWKHTGRTALVNCDDRTDHGYIWNDNPNKTFKGCYFSTRLVIEASGVVITESQIHGAVIPHWSSGYSLKGAVFEDVEIESCLVYTDCSIVDDRKNPDGSPMFDYENAAISGHDFTCRRCNIHNTVTGAHPGNNALIVDSFLHDFQIETDTNDENAPLKSHGAAVGEGQNNGYGSKIIHSNLQCNRLPGQYNQCSSALSLYDEPQLDDVEVRNNLFNTANGYCTYGGGTNGTNIRFIDNYFGKKFNPFCGGQDDNIPVAFFYFPNDTKCDFPRAVSPKCNYGNVWQGNVWADGSGEVPTNKDAR